MMPSTQRFLALDVFRGMTICLMIIVNTPGNYTTTFAPLLHANWHGFTPTDLVFPSFLFAVGNAMSFVLPKWANQSQAAVLTKILKRTALIFLLGYLMYWFPFVKFSEAGTTLSPISQTRIMGVLQRIALCYGITALLLYYCKPKITVIISVLLLFLYWALCSWFGDAADPYSLTGNAALKFDLWLMGEQHLYRGEGIPFDPEGWLSTLPAIGNVVAGYVAGAYLQRKGKSYEALTRLLLSGFALVILAYFWNFLFPINKKLWTSSFVVHTVGLDLMLLAAIIYRIEFRSNIKWTYFFEVFGKNPLFIYLLSEVVAILLYTIMVTPDTSLFSWIYQNGFRFAGEYLGSLLFALSFMLFCWSVGYWMDRKKVYVKV